MKQTIIAATISIISIGKYCIVIIILVDISGIEPPHKVELTQSKCRVKPLCLFDKRS
jgi:hypothetical protein